MDLLIFQVPILMVQASLDGILLGILFAPFAYIAVASASPSPLNSSDFLYASANITTLSLSAMNL